MLDVVEQYFYSLPLPLLMVRVIVAQLHSQAQAFAKTHEISSSAAQYGSREGSEHAAVHHPRQYLYGTASGMGHITQGV